jgi:hypothetical protein
MNFLIAYIVKRLVFCGASFVVFALNNSASCASAALPTISLIAVEKSFLSASRLDFVRCLRAAHGIYETAQRNDYSFACRDLKNSKGKSIAIWQVDGKSTARSVWRTFPKGMP